jgi:hypothetical protein
MVCMGSVHLIICTNEAEEQAYPKLVNNEPAACNAGKPSAAIRILTVLVVSSDEEIEDRNQLYVRDQMLFFAVPSLALNRILMPRARPTKIPDTICKKVTIAMANIILPAKEVEVADNSFTFFTEHVPCVYFTQGFTEV